MDKQKARHIENEPPGASDRLAGKISGGLRWLQIGFARKMNRVVRNIQAKRLRLWVSVFFLLGGGCSVYLITTAFHGTTGFTTLSVQAIERPIRIDKTDSEIGEGDSYVNEATFQKIQDFKKYMDGLKVQNVRQYDSILFQRPKLIDSVRLLEALYYSQKQTAQHEK